MRTESLIKDFPGYFFGCLLCVVRKAELTCMCMAECDEWDFRAYLPAALHTVTDRLEVVCRKPPGETFRLKWS